MVDVVSKREAFVAGLVENAGWDRQRAEQHFDEHSSHYGLDDVADSVRLEAQRLRRAYTGVCVAPLVYALDDHCLYQLMKDARSVARECATYD